jgi:DNA-binding transcriptional LysR family regulator
MDLRQLEILRAISESGSFTAAGDRLRVSQSAISRQVLLLESELNESLFLRVGRRVRMTAAGEALLRLGHRVLQDLTDTVASISDPAKPVTGTVRLVGGMTVAIYVFPALLKEFHRSHPRAELKITAGAGEHVAPLVRHGGADIGLLTLPIDDPDLVTVPALEEELMLVAAAAHPLARRRAVSAADLRRQQFVLFERGSNTRRVIDDFLARGDVDPRIVMETENVEIIKALVRAGLGISIIPYLAVAREVSSGRLFVSRIHGESLWRRTGWVYARTTRMPRPVQAVLEAFEKVKPRLRLSPGRARR